MLAEIHCHKRQLAAGLSMVKSGDEFAEQLQEQLAARDAALGAWEEWRKREPSTAHDLQQAYEQWLEDMPVVGETGRAFLDRLKAAGERAEKAERELRERQAMNHGATQDEIDEMGDGYPGQEATCRCNELVKELRLANGRVLLKRVRGLERLHRAVDDFVKSSDAVAQSITHGAVRDALAALEEVGDD